MSEENLSPYEKLTISNTSDGEGGWTKAIVSAGTLYLRLRIHENRTLATCRIDSDVTVKDLLRIDGAIYEVMSVSRVATGHMKELELDRQDRPIEPVTGSGS